MEQAVTYRIVRWVLAFALGMLFVQLAHAAQCVTAEDTIALTVEKNPNLTVEHVFLAEDQRAKFVANLNAAEPKTNYEGAQVLVFAATGMMEVVVALFGSDGCREFVDVIPMNTFVRMINVTADDNSISGGN